MLKTNNYEMFKLRDDNRGKLDRPHIQRLKESITARNLLELRPIEVNDKMEVLDGQHRLMAAKELGVTIYYKIQRDLSQHDIIIMNVTKNWTITDYLNFYVKNQYDEYIKLKRFLDNSNLSLKLGLTLTVGRGRDMFKNFREGKYTFHDEEIGKEISACWETIHLVKQLNGFAFYLDTSKLWKSLMKLIRHPDFDNDHWLKNLKKMIERFSPRVSEKDYLKMMIDIYNWRHNVKLKFVEEEVYE